MTAMASWVYPTLVPVVTSNFNPTRRHPVTGVITPHTGTDFRAATGAPLRAATTGTVVRSTDAGGGAGRYIRIDVGGGVWIGYSHLSRRDVAVGDRVSTGQIIGLAGATGSVTAAHLHFEVCVDGTKVDPVPYLAARTVEFAGNPVGGGGGGSIPGITPLPPLEPIEAKRSKTMHYVVQQTGVHYVATDFNVQVVQPDYVQAATLQWGAPIPALASDVTRLQELTLANRTQAQAALSGKVDGVKGVADAVKVDTSLLKAGVATVHDLLVEHAGGSPAAPSAPLPEGGTLSDADVDRVADAVLARLASIAVTITPAVE